MYQPINKLSIFFLFFFIKTSIYSQYTQTEIDAFLNTATGTNGVGTEIIGNARYYYTNNYPDHPEGIINGGFTISATGSTWAMCAYPRLGGSVTQLYSDDETIPGCTNTYNFGVAINGVKFGPSSADFYYDSTNMEYNYDWHIEALSFTSLSSDDVDKKNIYGAHSTPGGLYHYHGEPVGYFAETVANGGLGIDGTSHSSIVGYAADGYPIYYKYGYANSDGTGGITTFDSGYQLKSGTRGGDGVTAPDGNYDGTYVEDYEFTVATKLDECNGRFGVTPDFPKGTYYYVITESWPIIPRCFAGAVLDKSFLIGSNCGDSNASSDCSAQVSTSNSFTWTGETNTDWNTVTNWVDDTIPTTIGYASIPDVSAESGNFPIIANDTEVVDVIIYPNAQLSVNSGKFLKLTSDLTNQGTLTINSDATSSGSLLISGESSGNITYNRYLSSSATSDEGWHLIASPVTGETENDIISTGNLLTNASSLYSLASYDNNSSGSGVWSYLNASSAATLSPGKGYSVKRGGSGTIPFVGSYRTTNLKNYEISVGTQNSWNLIGNPYPSFLAANDDADATNNFLTINSAQLDASYVALYFWNSSTKSYDIINHALESAKYIAPGQAFFVYSKTGGGEVVLRQTMQSHQNGNLFLKSSSSKTPIIKLFVSNGESEKFTQIKYIDGTTTGLDIGYDAGVFGAVENNFNVFSHLLSNSEGVDFSLQCLPPENYENMEIPIGVNALKENEIIFSVDALNLPEELHIIFEDRLLNVFIELNESSTYKVVLDSDENDIGRFYLHTTTNTLNSSTSIFKDINVYVKDISTLTISGLNEENTELKLYSLLGKEIFTTSFIGENSKNISLPILAKGVYLAEIITKEGKLNKKILLK